MKFEVLLQYAAVCGHLLFKNGRHDDSGSTRVQETMYAVNVGAQRGIVRLT